MKTVNNKTENEWLSWLGGEGVVLAKEKRDVRVTTHARSVRFGSISASSSALGKLTMRTYDKPEVEVVVDALDIQSVEIFNSRRLCPRAAYQQMTQMERIFKPTPPLNIDDTCP